jgi:membrane associated rhomboid family serine protease
MFPRSYQSSFRFGSPLTPLGKTLLIVYVSVYVAELVGENWLGIPIYSWLALSPITSGRFHVWQLVTHPLIHDPTAPIGFLINCLVFYFFAAPIESALGTRGFLRLYITAAVGGAAGGLIFSSVATLSLPYAGMMPSLLALIVVFGLLQPEATVLLFFILPIKAKYISYGTIIVTALTFLARTNVYGAYHLGGIALGYLCFRSPARWFDANWWKLKYFEYTLRRRRSRFTVIDRESHGKKKKPTLH